MLLPLLEGLAIERIVILLAIYFHPLPDKFFEASNNMVGHNIWKVKKNIMKNTIYIFKIKLKTQYIDISI